MGEGKKKKKCCYLEYDWKEKTKTVVTPGKVSEDQTRDEDASTVSKGSNQSALSTVVSVFSSIPVVFNNIQHPLKMAQRGTARVTRSG